MIRPPGTPSSAREVHDLLRVELDRVLARLTHLGPVRLSRPGAAAAAGTSAADLVRATLQPLADAVADATGERRHTVPVLADRAVGDQLAVLGADALEVDLPGTALAGLAQRLTALRRALP